MDPDEVVGPADLQMVARSSRTAPRANAAVETGLRRLAPRHGEDEWSVGCVVRGVFLARERDGDLGAPHLDLPNIGGDQLGVVDGCIVSDVPADRIDNNGLGYLLRHEAAGLARPQFGIQPAAAQQVTVAALFKDTAVIKYDQTVHGGNRREPMRNRDHGFA